MKQLKHITALHRVLVLCSCFMFFFYLSYAIEANTLNLATASAYDTQGCYAINFTFTAIDANGLEVINEQGTVSISGNKFRLEIDEELLIVCDGNTQWIYKPQTDDIIVSQSDIASSLETSKDETELVNNIVQLFVAPQESGVSSIVNIVKGADGNISEVIIPLEGKSCYKLKIDSLKRGIGFPTSYFTFDISEYPNAIITDMR